MKTYLFLLLAMLFVACNPATESSEVSFDSLSLIPAPRAIEKGSGAGFKLNAQSRIVFQGRFAGEADLLAQMIQKRTGLKLALEEGNESGENVVFLQGKELSEEAYELTIGEEGILIGGGSGKAMLHGVQTLLQMLPKGEDLVILPALHIKDQPRFAHRGLLLDACRHFWPVPVVKKYIDLLSRYKMNVLHWHLTEDQGWRAEIDRYPRLIQVGACRTEADSSKYCGFYSQQDMRDVVAYAAKRHVTVIPEIEMPGHSLAALAAYPHLACTPGPFEVTSEWGVFKDIYCAGNDSTFEFLENVLTEVMDIFPSRYIHIGGDESPKYRWEHCSQCQARMRAEGLEDEHELQSYFIRRIQQFLQANGRQLIGWDEILEGGLAEGAMVQSWRGMEGGVAAAKAGNFAIMSPTSHCYLDYPLQKIDLEKIYSFDPIPDGLSADEQEFIRGGECNMWTEHVPDEENLDSKVLPRMIGLAEVLWSYPEERDYDAFLERLQVHYPILELNFAVGFEKVPLAFKTEVVPEGLKVSVEKSRPDIEAEIESLDGPAIEVGEMWDHDRFFAESARIRLQAVLGKKIFPETFELPIAVHQALGFVPETEQEYSPFYAAGGAGGLTDGVLGTTDFRDGHWQGYQGVDMEFVLDLGAPDSIRNLGTQFYYYSNAWIFVPAQVEYLGSADGQNYVSLGVLEGEEAPLEVEQIVVEKKLSFGNEPVPNIRFIKVKIKNPGPCPDWHDAAGSPSWIFIDEITVNQV